MKRRVVEVPVRVVGGEAEVVGRAGGLEHLEEGLVLAVRVLERLRREADVVAGDLARLALEPRNLVAQRAPVRVQPPEDPGEPGDAALDQEHLEGRQALEASRGRGARRGATSSLQADPSVCHSM